MTTLEQAAYNYGEAVATLRSAESCGVPFSGTRELSKACTEACQILLKLAIEHFDNVYDGATE
jgi:hypothetical protein